ncbi:hypothetical protein [Anaplasma bovis]|uniref:hypothetical protein n=1 Tax=Anaplasma bovis TaxID=186733 RepID=UPI002FF36C33
MMLPYSIPRRMLAIEKLNYRRQCCSAVTCAITVSVFLLLALRQGHILGLASAGQAVVNVWVIVDFVSLIAAATSLLCGMVLVFVVERRKSKIRKLIIEESRRYGFRSRIAEERNRKNFLDKASDLIEDTSNKLDLVGSSFIFATQICAVVGLLAFGLQFNNSYKVGTVGMGDFFDLVGNSAFLLSVFLFTVSHMIVHRNVKKYSKSQAETAKLLAVLLCGNIFVLGGKILLVLESVGILNRTPMPFGETGHLPLAWMIRLLGTGLCVLGLYVTMQNTSNKCDELSKVVERGDGAQEVMSTLSTHEVRSCFGYLEYGTR